MKNKSILIAATFMLLTGAMYAQAPAAPSMGTSPKLKTVVPATPGQHGLNLAWTDCATCTTNIYKGTTPGGENYTTPYATVAANTFVYLDPTGTGGVRYYYTATAVLNGIESSPSTEASGLFPTVPTSPTNLTVTPQ